MGVLDFFSRQSLTVEQAARLQAIPNGRQRKAIASAIRAGKRIPESAWAPLPAGVDVGRLIEQENAQAGGSQGRTASPEVSAPEECLGTGVGRQTGGSTFQLWSHSTTTSLDKIGNEEGLKTLFGWGIVNPYGPTLTVVTTDGILYKQGRTLPIVYLMLNPFQQEVQIVGEATIGEGWDTVADLYPLFDVRLGACPTLLLPSKYREAGEDVEFYAQLLSRFDDGSSVLERVRRFPGDPWHRVKEDMRASARIMASGLKEGKAEGQGTTERRLTAEEARELASHLLEPKNLRAELDAFMYAWQGSIKLQESQGAAFLAKEALSTDKFAKQLLRLALTCRLPEREA